MTEQLPERPVDAYDDEHDESGPSLEPDGHVRTGNVTVDAVLASMEGLEDAPVSEHVAVFEHAHEQLRRALDGADGAAGGPGADGR
jgi:hypothetical protein